MLLVRQILFTIKLHLSSTFEIASFSRTRTEDVRLFRIAVEKLQSTAKIQTKLSWK